MMKRRVAATGGWAQMTTKGGGGGGQVQTLYYRTTGYERVLCGKPEPCAAVVMAVTVQTSKLISRFERKPEENKTE